MRIIKRVLVLLVILGLESLASSESLETLKNNDATKLANTFCKAEFTGDDFDQRVNLVKFSPEREKIEIKRANPASPYVVFWDWDPYYIVLSYKVISVDIKGLTGVAVVQYKSVGESEGKEQLTATQKQSIVEKINLFYDGKQWWIKDPPKPKISLEAINKYYENDMKIYNDPVWIQKASKQQKMTYYRKEKARDVIKQLISKYFPNDKIK